MKVLLDHCVPKRFRRVLPGHEVRTTYEAGWADLSNGRLLARAATQFDAFITVDQNVQFQQNLATIPIPAAILIASDNRFETLAPFGPAVLRWLAQRPEKGLVRIDSHGTITDVTPQ